MLAMNNESAPESMLGASADRTEALKRGPCFAGQWGVLRAGSEGTEYVASFGRSNPLQNPHGSQQAQLLRISRAVCELGQHSLDPPACLQR